MWVLQDNTNFILYHIYICQIQLTKRNSTLSSHFYYFNVYLFCSKSLQRYTLITSFFKHGTPNAVSLVTKSTHAKSVMTQDSRLHIVFIIKLLYKWLKASLILKHTVPSETKHTQQQIGNPFIIKANEVNLTINMFSHSWDIRDNINNQCPLF